MSHGPSSEEKPIEPNLTPLLDVVMQLLMFFMMTVNFVNEQVTGEVKLPTSQSAVPISKSETEVGFINIKIFHINDYLKDANGDDKKNVNQDRLDILRKKFAEDDPCAVIITEEYPLKLIELKVWLKNKFQTLKGHEEGKVNYTIIIRADEKLDYAPFYQILTFCKEAGFKQMKIRAKTKVGGDT